jgi:hypothetical protein
MALTGTPQYVQFIAVPALLITVSIALGATSTLYGNLSQHVCLAK